MRVATLNLWGVRGDWPARRALLRERFRRYAPDVVTFQEAIETGSYDQTRDILGPDYHVAHQAGREEDGQGVSTASRWPIAEVVEVDLQVDDRTKDFACTSLITEIYAPPRSGGCCW